MNENVHISYSNFTIRKFVPRSAATILMCYIIFGINISECIQLYFPCHNYTIASDKNNNDDTYNTSHMPGTFETLHMVTHFFLTIVLQDGDYYIIFILLDAKNKVQMTHGQTA